MFLRIFPRFLRLVALHSVVWLLAVMLVFVPPSGAVCWPLLEGWHLHIGWTSAAGQPTVGLVVYAHRSPARVVDPHSLAGVVAPQSAGFSTLVAPDIVNSSDLRPLADGALWLLLLPTLCWLCSSQVNWRRQPEPNPLDRPPTACAAF